MGYDFADEYYEWLTNLVRPERYSKALSFDKLLSHLYSVDFRYSIPMDENRACDGVGLRRRFALSQHCDIPNEYRRKPCTVLEMMIALAVRCEEDITDDPRYGSRIGQWFWEMVVNLGLGSMLDSRYDEGYVEFVIQRFLDREYEPNGEGGLFVINNCGEDLRDVEIWNQLDWYLADIV